MSLRVKFLMGVLAVTAMTLLLGGYAVSAITGIGAVAIDMYEKPLMAINFTRSAETQFALARAEFSRLRLDAGTDAEELVAQLAERQEGILEDLEVAEERAGDEETLSMIVELRASVEAWAQQNESILAGNRVDESEYAELTEEIATSLADVVELATAEGFMFRLEAEESVEWQKKVMFGVAAAGLVWSITVGLLMGHFVVTRLKRAITALQKLSDGDTDVDLPRTANDEIGALTGVVSVFRNNLIEMDRMRADQAAQERQRQRKLQTEMGRVCSELENEVKETVAGVTARVEGLSGLITGMSAASSQVKSQSASVSTSAEDASESVQAVAGAAEQMSQTSDGIRRDVGHATDIARRAVDQTQQTNASVKCLSDAAEQIGEVVGLISDIAEQTNLLALNATIEAARAGDAGKGFAVVASEVKSLANQTAQATERISGQIQTMQVATSEAVDAIGGIGKTSQEINTISAKIASAIAEQQGAIVEIAHQAQHVSEVVGNVSTSIADVSVHCQESDRQADESRGMVDAVADEATRLESRLSEILQSYRAGERRLHDREAVSAVTRIQTADQWHDCEIRSLSASGALCSGTPGLECGDRVVLEIPGFETVEAEVARLDGDNVGLEFDTDADTQERLAAFVDLERAA